MCQHETHHTEHPADGAGVAQNISRTLHRVRTVHSNCSLAPPAQTQILCAQHWGELVSTARKALFCYARLHAEDVVSEVVVDIGCDVLPSLPSVEPAAIAFLKGVIRNRARHVNRRESRLRPLSEWQAAATPDSWQLALRVQLTRDVAHALSGLTRREREVASHHWLEEWSSPDIAANLRISNRSVKELLRRARRKLRAALAHYDDARRE